MARSELIQEMARKLKDEAVMWQLVKHNLLNPILTQLLDIFSTETSQSIQFELMTIICSLPQLVICWLVLLAVFVLR